MIGALRETGLTAPGPDRPRATKDMTLNEFLSLGLNERLCKKVAEIGHTTPTPIQVQAIPQVLDGRDVMGLAQTGTGKTLAFGLPLIQDLLTLQGRPAMGTVRALILAPTRELAKQIAESLGAITRGSPLGMTVVTGGASMNAQADRLRRGVDILVATPGRLVDLLERRALRLDETRALVLDEADQMLDMGFIHALRRIARHLPVGRQTLLFSATMPKLMEEVAATYLRNPVRVEVAPPGKTADKVTQFIHFAAQGDKAKVLEEYLDSHRDELALVFARTKHGAEKLMKLLASWGFAAGSIHGNKSQGQRDRALKAFRNGELRVLVATDVAARGIDIPEVRHVYNYDLPNVPENYVHRIGRTARAGRDGRAITLCAPLEMEELEAVEKALGQAIPVIAGARWETDRAKIAAARKAKAGGRGGRPAAQGKPARKPEAGAKPGAARPAAKRPAKQGKRPEKAPQRDFASPAELVASIAAEADAPPKRRRQRRRGKSAA